MPNKIFLEAYPLYKKFDFVIDKPWFGSYGSHGGTILNELPEPAINMLCPICKSTQTFNMINEYPDSEDKQKTPRSSPAGLTFKLDYLCSSCKRFHYEFYLEFGVTKKLNKKKEEIWSNGWVRKIGQKPEWSIDIDKHVENFLSDENISLFKKGLICESQSYGIGAYSYYRRIIESIISDLLTVINELIPEGEEKVAYEEALKKTKEEIVAANKISLIKDLLPRDLLTEGYNPLNVIYSSISDGLHNWSDEECLEISEAIRKCICFLIARVYANKSEKKEFTEGMKKLLAGKFKK